ncbi:hypothetical protein SAMN05421841_2501 [Chryseobacterium wanjuense]|jgi:hypothetical protein|uniref:Uncharacterized protein n=1 Tax=Chryseobacterium wanjuense TaxID=356305 RepID=A0A1I0RD08_9FLAO|nr:hypothetical protein SAMN05421841_2501 [Chryseobacterium wanjuense]
MKPKLKEKNSLPLTFKYIELFKTQNLKKLDANTIFYIPCDKYQTNFYIREKPFKPLVRML